MEQKILKILQADTYKLLDLGGHSMAYFGKLKCGLYYGGNEESLFISTIDLEKIYYYGGCVQPDDIETIFYFEKNDRYFKHFYKKMQEKGF